MQIPEFTHKGWVGFAPIYTTATQDAITPRPYTTWMLHASLWVEDFIAYVMNIEDHAPIRVTGELNTPYKIKNAQEI